MGQVIAYIGLGSNLGERKIQLLRAIDMLRGARGIQVLSVSTILETDPVGLKDQPSFLNCIVKIATALKPFALRDMCLDIESRLGRVRTGRWKPRTVDLDILLYGRTQMLTRDLTLPHPCLFDRPFLLWGLRELGVTPG